jgi:hypothetical protein
VRAHRAVVRAKIEGKRGYAVVAASVMSFVGVSETASQTLASLQRGSL